MLGREHSHFHVLIKTIIEQQLSVKSAQSIAQKLLFVLRSDQFEAQFLLEVNANEMRSCGLSAAKVRYIRGIAEAVTAGDLSLEKLESWDDQQAIKHLMYYPGIGLWTAEVFLMFALGRLDVLPLGDLVLRNAIKRYYQLDSDAGRKCYLEVAEPWRPYRSVASWYLWAMLENE